MESKIQEMKPCSKCSNTNWSTWTSASTGKIHKYCKSCRQNRANIYNNRKNIAQGKHTERQWQYKRARYDFCPECLRPWSSISPRPDKRYKYVWTKDHIIPLNQGGTNDIDNIQPLCYQCNFGKR